MKRGSPSGAGIARVAHPAPAGIRTFAAGCDSGPPAATDQPPAATDFIVVGSGAGGGTVAARLVEAGYSVLVLEAGDDPQTVEYDVPAFHPFATENEAMRWDFFVHHYSDPDEGAARSEVRAPTRGACGIRVRARSAGARRTTR